VVGWRWAESPSSKRQWRGRELNLKLRSSNASIDVNVRKHAARAAAHSPEVRSGRPRVDAGALSPHSSYLYARLCGKSSSSKLFISRKKNIINALS
jgi:hypothetical protein